MPVQIDKEWVVVEGDRILYRADSESDAEEWQAENGGEVVALPKNPPPSLI